MDQLERLKKKRTSIRASLSKVISKIDEELCKQMPDVAKLEEMFEILIDKDKSLTKIDEEVENVTKTEDLENEVSRSQEYKDIIIRTKTKLIRALKGPPQEEGHSMYFDGEPVYQNVKLPKLVIEKFYGDVSKCNVFGNNLRVQYIKILV